MSEKDYDDRLDDCARALYEKDSNMAATVTAFMQDEGQQAWTNLAVDTERMPDRYDGRIQTYLISAMVTAMAEAREIPPEEVMQLVYQNIQAERESELAWVYDNLG